MNRRSKVALTLTAALAAGVTFAACSSPGTTVTIASGGRAELYSSVDELTADSSAIAVVTVTGQEVFDRDGTKELGNTYTVSDVDVLQTRAPDALNEARDAAAHVAPGASIQVRQMGDPSMDLPAPILEVGKSYLLFLVPSGLPGDEAEQFFITGGTAGYFAAPDRVEARSAGTQSFEKVGDEGDTLPADVTLDQLDNAG
ncbi:hypothetical protein ACFWH7_03690 [Cellulosimicrobium cellulans]|uniref:hypothetical protein n=1 Tax=Cellulosimicrobium cellulans TaxID=1710 RepID=UPI003652F2C4